MNKSIFFSFVLIQIAIAHALSAVTYYECGVYAGVETGWAIIDTPTCSNIKKHEAFKFADFDSCKGDVSWGAHVGFNYPLACDTLVGVEAGYHDNGYSSLFFTMEDPELVVKDLGEEKKGYCTELHCFTNEYRIESTDYDFLATATYIWRPGLWFNVKVGAANVRQVYRVWHFQNHKIDPTSVVKHWTPTFYLGAGYNFCNFDLYVGYRYVYGEGRDRLSKVFNVRGAEDEFPGRLELKDRNACVHGFYVGLQASLY